MHVRTPVAVARRGKEKRDNAGAENKMYALVGVLELRADGHGCCSLASSFLVLVSEVEVVVAKGIDCAKYAVEVVWRVEG